VDVEEDTPVDDIAGKKRGTGLVVAVIAAGGDDPLTDRGQDEQGGDDGHQENGPGARRANTRESPRSAGTWLDSGDADSSARRGR